MASQDIQVEGKVGVGNEVPQARDLSPGDIGIPLSQIERKLLDGFAENVKIEQDSIESQLVREDLIARQPSV